MVQPDPHDEQRLAPGDLFGASRRPNQEALARSSAS